MNSQPQPAPAQDLDLKLILVDERKEATQSFRKYFLEPNFYSCPPMNDVKLYRHRTKSYHTEKDLDAEPDFYLTGRTYDSPEGWTNKISPNTNNVDVIDGKFDEVSDFDCAVAPSNSFGLMDGVFDTSLLQFFGIHIQDDVQKHIIEHFSGEQSVGTAFVIATEDFEHPWLVHSPVMRIPYNIQNTDNVYLALAAALREVHNFNKKAEVKIKSILCNSIGAGDKQGEMSFDESARQMYLAWRNFNHPPSTLTWQYAHIRQSDIRFGGQDGLLVDPTNPVVKPRKLK